MATKIVTKNSSTASAAPTASDLVQGELAVNVTDKRLYTENASGAIVELGTSPSTIDINAGTIDGTVIGAASASTGAFTTLSASGEITGASLDISGDIDVDGTTNLDVVDIDGAVDMASTLQVDGAATFTTEITANGGIALGDSDKATFGAGDDLQIYHTGSVSVIADEGTGNLLIRASDLRIQNAAGSSNYLKAVDGAEVEIMHNGSAKLATTATGIDVTGTATMDGLTVDGNATFTTADNTAQLTLVSTDTDALVGPQLNLWRNSGAGTNGDLVGEVTFTGEDTVGATNTFATISAIAEQTNNGAEDGSLHFKTLLNGTLAKRLSIGAASTGGDISFYEDTGTTAKLFWDASAESLGIGTSSPSTKLDVAGSGKFQPAITGGDALVTIAQTNSNAYVHAGIKINAGNANPFYIYQSGSSNTLRFNYNSMPDAGGQMAIDSSGNVLVGTTSTSLYNDTSGGGINLFANGGVTFAKQASSASDPVLLLNNTGSDGQIIDFRKDGATVGSISVTASATAYNTSSDYRLKEADVPMTGATERVKALRPINFAWKVDGSRVDGFFAHELAEVVPEAATGTKDAMRDEEYEVTAAVYEDVTTPAVEAVAGIEAIEAVEAVDAVYDDEGVLVSEAVEAVEAVEGVEAVEAVAETTESVLVTEAVMGTRSVPDYQGIDQAKLVPLLTATIQELIARIEALEAV